MLGALVVAVAVLMVGAGAFTAVNAYGGAGSAYEALVDNPYQTEDLGQRLTSPRYGFQGGLLEGRLGGVEGAP